MFRKLDLIVPYLRPVRGRLYLLFLLSGLTNILLLSPTIYMLQIYDRVLVSGSIFTLMLVSLMLVYFYVILGISEYFRSKILIEAGRVLDGEFSGPLFDRLLNVSHRGVSINFSEYLNYFVQFRQWLTGPGAFSFLDLPWALLFLVVLYFIHPLFLYFSVLAVVSMVLLTILSIRLSREAILENEYLELEESRFVRGRIRSPLYIKIYSLEEKLHARWKQGQDRNHAKGFFGKILESTADESTKNVRLLFNSLALGLGAVLVIEGELSIGLMIASSLIVSRVLAPVDQLSSAWKSLGIALYGISKINQLPAFSGPVMTSQGRNIPFEDSDSIVLQGLSLGYKRLGADSVILRVEDEVRFPSGAISLVVGPSGTGKSTLLKFLSGSEGLRLQDITGKTNVLILPNEEVGYISQALTLFPGTIAQNISKFGKLDSTEIVRVCDLVGIHRFILSLSQGYDTEVKIGDLSFSSGQLQLMSLARALYKTPKFLVLDEPDSHLDPLNQARVREIVTGLAEKSGLGVVISSHNQLWRPHANAIYSTKTGVLSLI